MYFFWITSGKQMSDCYTPRFNRIGFVVTPSYIELPWIDPLMHIVLKYSDTSQKTL